MHPTPSQTDHARCRDPAVFTSGSVSGPDLTTHVPVTDTQAHLERDTWFLVVVHARLATSLVVRSMRAMGYAGRAHVHLGVAIRICDSNETETPGHVMA